MKGILPKDIAGNSDKGRTINNQAVAKAESASLKVNEPSASAAQISKVTEVITEISERTDLVDYTKRHFGDESEFFLSALRIFFHNFPPNYQAVNSSSY